MIRHAVIAAIAWFCLMGSLVAQTVPARTVQAQTIQAQTVPAPTLPTQALIFPALSGRVVDDAGLLSASDRDALTRSLAGLEAQTSDQIVVVTLKTLQGRPIEEYGYQLGRAWGIGQRGKDSGALLIVAAAERKVRIEVGYGLEGTLTDAATKVIVEATILPRFRAGDFPGGIKAGAAAIGQLLVSDAGSAPRPTQGSVTAVQGAPMPVWLIIVLGLAGAGLLIVCTITGGQGLCSLVMQMVFMMALSGRGGSPQGRPSSFSGGGGSFGGGGSSGSW